MIMPERKHIRPLGQPRKRPAKEAVKGTEGAAEFTEETTHEAVKSVEDETAKIGGAEKGTAEATKTPGNQ
jgi:hypothetical protein